MATMPAGTKVPLKHKGQLRVCALISGEPYVSEGAAGVAGTGKVHGFDVDVLSLVGERIKAAPIFVKLNPEVVVNGTALRSGACDIVTGLTDWSGFAKTYRLTKPYERRSFALLTKKGGPASPAALAGKRVGVIGDGGGTAASDPYAYLKRYNAAHGGQIRLVPQTDTDAEVVMVQNGALDAMATDDGRARYYAKKQPSLAASGVFGPGYPLVFGVRKGDGALARQVDAALADAGGNGQYASAYWNWFGVRPAWTPGG
jgi:polar amino acid transport system substrate-binding protein